MSRMFESKISTKIQDGNDTLVVILSSTLRDYVIEDKTRKVIEGDPQQDLFTVYQMNFIRKHGTAKLKTMFKMKLLATTVQTVVLHLESQL